MSFAGGYFAGRAAEPDPKGVAPSAMVATIDEMLAATGDEQQLATFFYEDAVLTMMNSLGSQRVEGADAVAAALTGGTATDSLFWSPICGFGVADR